MAKVCPYRIALEVIVGKKPPPWIRGNLAKFNEQDHDKLILWIGHNVQSRMLWVTLHGVVDAVCLLVQQAKDNGNFRDTSGSFDLEHRTDIEIAEDAERVLGGPRLKPFEKYTLHGSVHTARRILRPGTEVFVQRQQDGAIYLRESLDGASHSALTPRWLPGVDEDLNIEEWEPL